MKINKKSLIALLIIVVLLLVLLLLNLKSIGKRPEIYSVSKNIASSGDTITIRGNYLGGSISRGRVYINGNMVYGDFIKSWDNDEITLILSDDFKSGMLTVDSMFGESKPFLLSNYNDIPVVVDGSINQGFPKISDASYLDDSGTLIEVKGFGFGVRQKSSNIEIRSIGLEDSLISDLDIVYWGDDRIEVYMPYPVGNIIINILNKFGSSNEYTLHLEDVPNVVYVKNDKKSYTFVQEVEIKNIITLKNSFIDLYIPLADNNYNQQVSYNNHYGAKYNSDGDYLTYRVHTNESGEEFEYYLETNIDVYSVDLKIKDDEISNRYDPDNPEYIKGFQETPGVSSGKSIKDTASWIVRNTKNRYKQTELLYSWILKYVKRDAAGSNSADVALSDRVASDAGLVNLTVSMLRSAGIPARVISGIKIDDECKNYNWIEFFISGCGWIPLDLLEISENKEYNIGKLDSNKICFSKGVTVINYESSNFLDDFYALQNSTSKSYGNVESYDAIWHNVYIK